MRVLNRLKKRLKSNNRVYVITLMAFSDNFIIAQKTQAFSSVRVVLRPFESQKASQGNEICVSFLIFYSSTDPPGRQAVQGGYPCETAGI
jgi:hypothetical protein